MNNEDTLFKNKFIKKTKIEDYDSGKVKEYLKKYEAKQQDKYEAKQLNPKPEAKQEAKKSRDHTKINVVSIDTRDRDTEVYPNANDFVWTFEQEYTNINKIELISTEIPNSDQTIKNSPVELANDTINWVNQEDSDLNLYTNVAINTTVANTIDLLLPNTLTTSTVNILIYNSKYNSDVSITSFIDGKYQASVIDSNTLRIKYTNGIAGIGVCNVNLGYPVYTVKLTPGNYNLSSLMTQVKTQLNKVKRRNGIGQYHYFDVSYDNDTNIITLESVITKQLANNPVSTTANSTIITVSSLNHGFKTGDKVRMIGCLNVAGITGDTLTGSFVVNVVDFNTFTYEVVTSANGTTNGGGSNVLSGAQAPYRILFQTTATIIQYNIGYNNEDSSEYIGASNPLTTKTLSPSNVIIGSNIPVNTLRLTTTTPHGLYACNTLYITSITNTSPVIVTTSSPHLLQLQTLITVINSNSIPNLNGDFFVRPTGPYTFECNERMIDFPGNSGIIFWGGDQIQLVDLKTIPAIDKILDFYVTNVIGPNTIEIPVNVSQIVNFENCVIRTSQVTVNHPSHSFNELKSVTHSFSETNIITGDLDIFTSVSTLLNNSLIGSRNTLVAVIDGPVNTNTIDLTLISHGLVTSDTIIIKDSTTLPVVDGIYKVQVLTQDIIRLNFVHATLTPGTCTVVTGDTVSITNSNSIPRVDGVFNINNRDTIVNISTGLPCVITLQNTCRWVIGDTISITNTNSTPNINGEYTIVSVAGNNITINFLYTIMTIGNIGVIVNTSRFIIQTNTLILTPGTFANMSREQSVILYRIASETLNSNSFAGIKLKDINGISFDILKLIDSSSYIIRVRNSYADKTITGGGTEVYVSSMNSGWRAAQANTTSGTKDDGSLLARAINLAGESYLLLTSPTLNGNSTFKVSSKVQNVLGKISLKDSPGLMNYDGFITSPTVFEPPLNKLGSMHFRMVNRDEYLFNFKDLNYSFSLRITEEHKRLINANENTRSY